MLLKKVLHLSLIDVAVEKLLEKLDVRLQTLVVAHYCQPAPVPPAVSGRRTTDKTVRLILLRQNRNLSYLSVLKPDS